MPELGHHHLHEDVQLAAADKPVIVGGILAQVEGQMPGLLGLDDFARRVPDLGLHAATTDRPRHRAIFTHQQLGAFVTGNGAAHLDDGGEGALLTQAAQPHQLFVDVHWRSL